MKELILIVEIIFLEIARGRFNFPITNSIRLSFWIPDDEVSTFSEIQVENKQIDIGRSEIVKIKLIERNFLANRIERGTEFGIGIFPEVIAIGKVIKVQTAKGCNAEGAVWAD